MNAGTIGDARKRLTEQAAAASEPPFSLGVCCELCGQRLPHSHVPLLDMSRVRLATYGGSDPS